MTKLILNLDQPQHRLLVDDVEIWGGKTGAVSDERAEELVAAPWANVMIVESRDKWPTTHAKLDEFAGQLDFNWPEPENDKSLSVADKVAALEAAGYLPDGTKAETTETVDDAGGADDLKE